MARKPVNYRHVDSLLVALMARAFYHNISSAPGTRLARAQCMVAHGAGGG